MCYVTLLFFFLVPYYGNCVSDIFSHHFAAEFVFFNLHETENCLVPFFFLWAVLKNAEHEVLPVSFFLTTSEYRRCSDRRDKHNPAPQTKKEFIWQ